MTDHPSKSVVPVFVGLTCLFAISGGGCKVGPEFARPDAALPAGWTAEGATADQVTSASATREWWTQFNDPILDRLIAEALRQNLALDVAGTRVLQARAARGISAGEFFPQVQELNAGIDANQLSKYTADGQGDRSFANDSISLDAIWELDFWGKFRRAIEASDAELLASVADYQAVMVSLIADVASTYVQLRTFEERLTLAKANVALQAETLKLTQAKYKAGAVSEFDVAIIQAQLANTEALIPDLQDGLKQTRLALCVLLGRPPGNLSDIISVEGPIPVPPPGIAVGIPADLLRRRPDVRFAEQQAASASARVGVATADLYPAISIVGSTGFGASTYDFDASSAALGDIFSAGAFQGFVGLRLSLPIFDYGRRENRILLEDARFQESILRYQQVVLAAAADVEAGLSTFLRSRDRALKLQEAVDSQQRSVDISLIQYRTGAISVLGLNFTQTDLVTQQDSLAVAQAAQALGAIRAFRALGGGWEVHDGREFVRPETAEQLRQREDWDRFLQPDYEQGKDLIFERPKAGAMAGPEEVPTSPGPEAGNP